MKKIQRQHIVLSLATLLLAAQVFTLVWMWKHPCAAALVGNAAAPSPAPAADPAATPVAAAPAPVTTSSSAYRGLANATTDAVDPGAPDAPTEVSPTPRYEGRGSASAHVRKTAQKASSSTASLSPSPAGHPDQEDPANPLPPGHRPGAGQERLAYPRAKSAAQSALASPPPPAQSVAQKPIAQPVYPVAHYSRF